MKSSLFLVATLVINLGGPFGTGAGVAATADEEDWPYYQKSDTKKNRHDRCKTDDASDPLKVRP